MNKLLQVEHSGRHTPPPSSSVSPADMSDFKDQLEEWGSASAYPSENQTLSGSDNIISIVDQKPGEVFARLALLGETLHQGVLSEDQMAYLKSYMDVVLFTLALKGRKSDEINLQDWSGVLKIISGINRQIGIVNRSDLTRLLHIGNGLSPKTEIFWKINRSNSEYSHRVGFNILQMLDKFSHDQKIQTVLEFGQGSGEFRRQVDLLDGYSSFSISDKSYYDLEALIKDVVIWPEGISNNDKALLCNLIYKSIVVKEGSLDKDDIIYDQEAIKLIQSNPNAIKDLLISKIHLLKGEIFPDDLGDLDSNKKVIYPGKIKKPQHLKQICQELINNIGACIDHGKDLFESIESYSPGVILGDFLEAKRIAEGQVDAAIAIRSTVYLNRKRYTDLLISMGNTLAKDGIYIDDGVRGNFDGEYRIPAICEARKKTKIPLYLISGPPLEGSGLAKAARAVIMTRDEAKVEHIATHLRHDFSMMKF